MLNVISGLESTAAALNAERIRMDVVGQNIANAQVTRGANGKPYQRQEVVFETVLNSQMKAGGTDTGGISVARVRNDDRPPIMVHRPGHADADKDGMVAMPNINTHEEMVDLIGSSRAFEANLAVIKASRAQTMQTLALGKRS